MSQVIVEPPLADVLRGSDQPTEMVDRSGRKLGYFVPTSRALREAYDQAWAEFNMEEFQAALADGPGRPLEDILRDLEARE